MILAWQLPDNLVLTKSLVHPASVTDGGLAAARSPNLTLSTKKLTEALRVTRCQILTGIGQNSMINTGMVFRN